MQRTAQEQVMYLQELCKKFPIDSIEDGLDENDWEDWKYLTEVLGKQVQIVGDELFVTNPLFLKKGIASQTGNAILIKATQIGTLTETLETIRLAHTHGCASIILPRSGETKIASLPILLWPPMPSKLKRGLYAVQIGSLSKPLITD